MRLLTNNIISSNKPELLQPNNQPTCSNYVNELLDKDKHLSLNENDIIFAESRIYISNLSSNLIVPNIVLKVSSIINGILII